MLAISPPTMRLRGWAPEMAGGTVHWMAVDEALLTAQGTPPSLMVLDPTAAENPVPSMDSTVLAPPLRGLNDVTTGVANVENVKAQLEVDAQGDLARTREAPPATGFLRTPRRQIIRASV
jgi:hypothetical protein